MSPRTPVSAAELEHTLATDPGTALFLAVLDGDPSGSAVLRRSAVAGSGYAMVRVLPERRRMGVGSALLAAVSREARARGLESLWGRIDEEDDTSLRFAAAHGFAESGREYEAVLELSEVGDEVEAPPAGVEIVSLAARPDLVRAAYRADAEGVADIPVTPRLAAQPFERWHAENLEGPGALAYACVVAIADGEVVGYAGLSARDAAPGTAEHLLTTVRRPWRGRGIAIALKRAQIAWAREAGLTRLVTSNDAPNAPMRAVNAKLGYRPTAASIHVRAPLA